jgi:ferrochelatase
MPQYDSILIVAFGGPEGPDDVLPFLENVLRGRNVPRARMFEVAEHYWKFGGVSPLNSQVRALIAALESELAACGAVGRPATTRLPVYWGNRNWHPLLAETIGRMADDGRQRALAIVLSAYSSYSSCRQYLENIEEARAEVGERAPAVELVSEELGRGSWRLVYLSRSGPPTQPWLGPDVGEFLRELYEQQQPQDVVVAPIGFLSDHMEVIYDLDTVAHEVCRELGMNMVRAGTVGNHPDVIRMFRQLLEERLDATAPRLALGHDAPARNVCSEDCCPSGRK